MTRSCIWFYEKLYIFFSSGRGLTEPVNAESRKLQSDVKQTYEDIVILNTSNIMKKKTSK